METEIKPSNPNKLNTGMKLILDHKNYNFDMGLNIYENLQEESLVIDMSMFCLITTFLD